MSVPTNGGTGAHSGKKAKENPRAGASFGNLDPWLKTLEPGQKATVVFLEDNFKVVFNTQFECDKLQIRVAVTTHPHPDNPPEWVGKYETACAGAWLLFEDVKEVGDSLKGQAWKITRSENGTELKPAGR